MNRILYHGSDHIIEKPEYGKGMRNNDYGRGFYCTENLELAKEWVCAKQKDGYANIYELNMEGLKVLNLNINKAQAFTLFKLGKALYCNCEDLLEI